MEIKFKQTEQMSEAEVSLTVSPHLSEGLVIIEIRLKTQNGNDSTCYCMDREELSDFIGTLIHVQSKLKRGV